MALSKEEAQDLLNDEAKLKAKIAFLMPHMRNIAFIRGDVKMIDILNRYTEETWLELARINLKKKVE